VLAELSRLFDKISDAELRAVPSLEKLAAEIAMSHITDISDIEFVMKLSTVLFLDGGLLQSIQHEIENRVADRDLEEFSPPPETNRETGRTPSSVSPTNAQKSPAVGSSQEDSATVIIPGSRQAAERPSVEKLRSLRKTIKELFPIMPLFEVQEVLKVKHGDNIL
jgi:hypothetical protein